MEPDFSLIRPPTGRTDISGIGSNNLVNNAVKQQAAVSGAGVAGAGAAVPGFGEGFMNMFRGENLMGENGGAALALSGLQSLYTMWNAHQQNQMAKKQFEFTKSAYKDQKKVADLSFNKSWKDRETNRGNFLGRDQAATDQEISKVTI